MFGYLRPCKPELKIKEFSAYKAVYCGLCHTLGHNYGFPARFLLSYDATLLSMLSVSLHGHCTGFEKRRCPAKPYKKCEACRESPELEFWAAASVILSYYKLKDNVRDGGILKKAAAFLLLCICSPLHKKAAVNQPKAESAAAACITAQQEVENINCACIDEAAQPTAEMVSSLLNCMADNNEQERILSRLGYFIGRFIYLADAADDLDDDIKSNNYNPYAAEWELKSVPPQEQISSKIMPLLNSCIYEIEAAYSLLECNCYAEITDNAFFLGLPLVAKAVTSGLTKKERREKFSAVFGNI